MAEETVVRGPVERDEPAGRSGSADRVKQGLLLAVVALLSLPFAGGWHYCRVVEDYLVEWRYRVLQSFEVRRPLGRVVVVAVDDRTLGELPERYPFNRRWVAKAIDALSEDGAAAVALDVVFAFRSRYDEEQDQVLARSIRSSGRVVMTRYPGFETAHAATRVPVVDWGGREPLPDFAAAAAGVGYAQAHANAKGSVDTLNVFGGGPDPEASLVLEALRVFFKAPRGWARYRPEDDSVLLSHFGGTTVVPLAQGVHPVDFRRLDDVEVVSFLDVVSKRCLRGTFKDRVVFLGLTSPLLRDTFPAPDGRDMGGVLLHAISAGTILEGSSLVVTSLPWRVAATFLAVVLGFVLAGTAGRTRGLALNGLACLAVFGLGTVALHLGVRVDVAPLVAGSWLFLYLGTFFFALRREAKQRAVLGSLLAASRHANVDPELLRTIDQTFGLVRPAGGVGGGAGAELPTGLQILGSFIAADYRNLTLIGKGGMGLVVRADSRTTGGPVAIKVLSPLLAGDEAAVRRFTREMEVMAALDHPNIVRILQPGSGELPYLVMEYLAGESLRASLNRCEGLDPDLFIDVFSGVLGGLDHAHAMGVIHRDLKPENVFLPNDGGVKILDFGLAHLERGTQLTQSGMLMGTFRYMSPEQLDGRDVTSRSDLYSVGVVMLECMLGPTEYVRRFGAYGQTRPSVQGLGSRWRAPGDLVAWCIEPDPADRPSSAKEARERLEELRGARSARSVATTVPTAG